MTLPSVGVDVSDSSLKYMRFTPSHGKEGGAQLRAWGDIPLVPGIVEDGSVVNAAELTKQLQDVRKKVGVPYIRMSLPEKHAYVFETTIDKNASSEEMRGLLEFKLQENVPLSPREALFDYEIVENSGEDAHCVVVTVYGKSTVSEYYDACTAAGFVPLSFEVEAQAIARAVASKREQGSTMVVDFGERHVGVGVVHNNVLVYTYTSDVGGRSLSDAMREVLGDTDEHELTRIKNEHGLRGTYKNKSVRLALVKVIEKLTDELESHIQYWNDKEHGRDERAVAEVVLCGGGANLAGLPEYLAKTLSVPVRRGNVWEGAFSVEEFVPPIDQRHAYGYATTIGLALAGITPFSPS